MPRDQINEENELARAEDARGSPATPAPAVDPVLEVLVRAREWLSDPTHWCRGACRSGDARCAIGAMDIDEDTVWSHHQCVAGGLLRRGLPKGFHGSIADFNDYPTTTHADVLALFDRAIAAASKA